MTGLRLASILVLTAAVACLHAETVQRYFFDQLSKDEIETMAAVFDRVLDNLRSAKA